MYYCMSDLALFLRLFKDPLCGFSVSMLNVANTHFCSPKIDPKKFVCVPITRNYVVNYQYVYFFSFIGHWINETSRFVRTSNRKMVALPTCPRQTIDFGEIL